MKNLNDSQLTWKNRTTPNLPYGTPTACR